MAELDALLQLRGALSTAQPVALFTVDPSGLESAAPSLALATHLAFPAGLLPKRTPTRFSTAPGASTYYDLETLLFAFLQRELSVAEYLRTVRENAVGLVSITDRRIVLDWLSGKSALEGPEGRITPLAGGAVVAQDGDRLEHPKLDSVPQPAKKARYTVDKKDQATVARLMGIIEGPSFGTVVGDGRPDRVMGTYRNRETVLKGERVNNFASVITLAASRLKLTREEVAKSSATAPAGAVVSGAGPGGKQGKKKQLTPIIVISPSSTALITMHNVKRFLEESQFEHSDTARNFVLPGDEGQVIGKTAEDVIQVNHARATTSISSTLAGGNGSAPVEARKARYFIVDGVEALSKFGGTDDAWERVVCVMTTGQEWQFKPYKWTEPKELFHHVKGVFVQWTNDPPNPKVRSWNVTELRIDPTKRHIDKSTVADFWRTLEAWIAVNKPWLSY